jgi:hypothetical protein
MESVLVRSGLELLAELQFVIGDFQTERRRSGWGELIRNDEGA